MGCTASDNHTQGENQEVTRERELMKTLQKNVIKIVDRKQLVTHVKKSVATNIGIKDFHNLRGLVAHEKYSGFTNCDEGIFKWNVSKIFGKASVLVKGFDNFHGKFDEMVYSQIHNCIFGVKAEASDSSIFKISLDGNLSKFKYRTGPLVDGKKLSLGLFENYLVVLRDDTSFEVLGGLEQKLGFVVDKPIAVSEEFIKRIVATKMFEQKKVAVFGAEGIVVFYEILNNCRIKKIFQKTCLIEQDEVVDCCDILHTGQIMAIATRAKSTPKASRLILQKIDFLNPSDKHWVFDFREEPEKYIPSDLYSNFFSLNVNFIIDGSPVIFGFQGSNQGKSTNLFVGILEKEKITELIYEVDYLSGEYIDSCTLMGQVYSLDSLSVLKVLSLPCKIC